MRPGSPDEAALRLGLRNEGVRLRLAGLSANLRIDVAPVVDRFLEMYCGHALQNGGGIDDVRIHIGYTGLVRRFVRRKTQVTIDGEAAFLPSHLRLAYLAVEASLNWWLSRSPSHVVVHSAVVERDGLAAILPAPSASGKSTLCAALVTRGWRLLSDELGLLRPDDCRLQPIARPISLKNDSIRIIRDWAPDGHFSPRYVGTTRGDIAFLRPPADSVARATEPATPGLIVSPRYEAGAAVTLQPIGKGETFRLLADNALNYHTTQRVGFETVARLVETCPAYRLSYGTLPQAVEAMEMLLAQASARASARFAAAAA